MKTCFISPHLDDVAFSCGGTLLDKAHSGSQVALCTVFTASTAATDGFALRCQTDKGIPADVDYMALRRSEDLAFARFAGIQNNIWLNFPEAPHRGYCSSAELFEDIHSNDTEILDEIVDCLRKLFSHGGFNEVYVPAANGGHVDHRLVLTAIEMAVKEQVITPRVYLYEELPYAINHNHPNWQPDQSWILIPHDISLTLDEKLEAVSCYRSQLPFQFGGISRTKVLLREHALSRANQMGHAGALEIMWRVAW
jgi:LmbE family N-acetylglucosaminyl deacetylase